KSAKVTANAKLKDVQTMYNEFKRTENSISAQSSKILRDRIVEMEREANSYEEKFFAEGGAMSIKKNELMKPLETKVIEVVNKLATQKGYDMIFDLSVAKITIFQKATLDLTDEVIALVKQ
ncbi:MAG: OmpH family outer membrane protein, partial [Rikenellaceae bacterium]